MGQQLIIYSLENGFNKSGGHMPLLIMVFFIYIFLFYYDVSVRLSVVSDLTNLRK